MQLRQNMALGRSIGGASKLTRPVAMCWQIDHFSFIAKSEELLMINVSLADCVVLLGPGFCTVYRKYRKNTLVGVYMLYLCTELSSGRLLLISSFARLVPLSARDCRAQIDFNGDHRKGHLPLFSFSFKNLPPFSKAFTQYCPPHHSCPSAANALEPFQIRRMRWGFIDWVHSMPFSALL